MSKPPGSVRSGADITTIEQTIPVDGPLQMKVKAVSFQVKEGGWACKVKWKLLKNTGRCDVWEFIFEELGAPVATRIVEYCGESKMIFESGKHAFFLEPDDPLESLPTSSGTKSDPDRRESPASQSATSQ